LRDPSLVAELLQQFCFRLVGGSRSLEACVHQLLDADVCGSSHWICATGHRRPAALYNYVAALIARGLFQRSKLVNRIRPEVEAGDAGRRR
jgi:hypothetical protein